MREMPEGALAFFPRKARLLKQSAQLRQNLRAPSLRIANDLRAPGKRDAARFYVLQQFAAEPLADAICRAQFVY